MSILDKLANTQLMLWVVESNWGYPIVISAHAIGMALAVGIILIYCLRVLGFAKAIPLPSFKHLFPALITGIVINVCSGALLFLANYSMFLNNTAFLTKIGLLIGGGLTTWYLNSEVNATFQTDTKALTVSNKAKIVAAALIVVWIGAISAGRIVAYTAIPI